MFKIIGGDGKEYGPASVEQVRAWLSAGRANLDTKAKPLGSEEWRRLGDFPEFGGPGELPPTLPARAAPGGLPITDTGMAASRGARTGAALINAAVYFFAVLPGSMAMSRRLIEQNPELTKGAMPRVSELDLSGMLDAVLWVWAGLLGAMLLQAILIALRGQNIGKIVVGARVVRADGRPAGVLRGVLLRFLVPVAIIMILNTLFPLGFLFLAIDYAFMLRADQRCLHDLMAGTKVVKSEK